MYIIKAWGLEWGLEETQTTWQLQPPLLTTCSQSDRVFSVKQWNECLWLWTARCSLCHDGPSWAQFNITLVVITTGWQQPSAQSSSTHSNLHCEVMPGSQARKPRSAQGYAVRSKFRGLLSRVCNSSINHTGWRPLLVFYKRGFSTFYCCASQIMSSTKSINGVTFKMSDFNITLVIYNSRYILFLFTLHMCLHMTKNLTWRSLFCFFGLDLRWKMQTSAKYQPDCKILALFLKQSRAWARLERSDASHPAAVPLFPGAQLPVKLVSLRR